MTTHRLTIKGQVTIPKEIRDYLGLAEGNSSVDFSIAPDGSVIVKKAGAGAQRTPALRSHSNRSVRPTASAVSGRAAHKRGGVLALLAGGF